MRSQARLRAVATASVLFVVTAGLVAIRLTVGRHVRDGLDGRVVVPDAPDGRYAAMLLAQTREELDKADLKATAIFTGATVVGTGLAITFPSLERGALTWLAFTSAAVTVAGLASVALAVWPRTGKGARDHTDYFMDVVALARGANDREAASAELAARLRREAETIFERDVRQLIVLSTAAARKYRYIKSGMVFLALGAGSLLLIVAFQALTPA